MKDGWTPGEGKLLFDGAMGTYFASLYHEDMDACEESNLTHPDRILAIHRAYLSAGSRAIRTNTFALSRSVPGDREKRLLRAGCALAAEAAAGKARVFGDLGPAQGQDASEKGRAYRACAEEMLRQGIRAFIFETLPDCEGLREALEVLRAEEGVCVAVSFAVGEDGYSRTGAYAGDLLREAARLGADVCGLNCVCGPQGMLRLLGRLHFRERPLTVMPNAGLPMVARTRTVYKGDPEGFARVLSRCVGMGAVFLGGCCGTTPEYIRACVRVEEAGETAAADEEEGTVKPGEGGDTLFFRRLKAGRRVIAVELDPPREAGTDAFMRGAETLKAAGADLLTLADSPMGRASMDPSLLACKVKRELDMDVLPHLTCRDRNVNATKALLLGLWAEGVRDVLLLTGDPVPTSERDEVKSVYQFNSRKLTAYVSAVSRNELPSPFRIFCALNVNAANPDIQLRLCREKMAAGAVGFLTQPVLSPEAVDCLRRAREELKGAFILCGLYPPVSQRNAEFLDRNVQGMRLSGEIIASYAGLDREAAQARGIALAVETARVCRDLCDGFYVVTPFGRAEMTAEIVRRLKRL